MNTLIKNNVLFILLAGLFLLAACKKEDDPFTGKDNYITSFSLKQGETVLNAVITDNVITIKAPEGLSLNGAAVTLTLSENASVYPDPETITEWDDDVLFAVTAHNGTQTKYKYTVNRSSIDASGSVVLETQADVDAFGLQGITAIGGNLVIGRSTGTDSITTLAPLAGLKEIAYSLIIYPTYSAAELVGLDNLEKVGNVIQIESLKNFNTVAFPALKVAGGMSVKNTVIQKADFPKLTTVTKSLVLDCPLSEIRFPNLKYVGGTISLNTASNSNAILSKISFPALEEAGSLSFSYFKIAKKVELPELKKVGDVFFNQLLLLSFINAPKLEVSTGTITISAQSMLVEISFPALTQAKNIIIDGKTLRIVEFPLLATVTNLTIQNALVNGIAVGFNSLTTIKGELYLRELSNMTTLSFPASLTSIGKLSIFNRSVAPLAEINIKGRNIGELQLVANAFKNAKIIGDDIFKGTLTLDADQANGTLPTFPALVGFTEVDSLAFGNYIAYMTDLHIKGIKKIHKGFRLTNNNILTFSISDLEEVGGDFIINHLNNVTEETIEIASLKKIGGNFSMTVDSRDTRTLKFPELTSVGGNFTLGTGYDDSWSVRNLETLSFPKLETIAKKLKLYASTYGYVNTGLVNLNGFSALKSVQAVDITQQTALLSYEGLKNALSSFTASNWTVSGNAYNPAYGDLKAGQWTKP